MIRERNFITYLLLSFITCGIYSIYFWYVYTEDLNQVFRGDGRESPNYIMVILLSFITCGIYSIYWFYKQGNRLQATGNTRYNVGIEESGTTILLWIVIGSLLCGIGSLVAQYLFINNMNRVAAVYNNERLSC